MARLIDADALKKYINENHSYSGLPMAAYICTMELLEYAPKVDAIKVIRCQNCQYSEPCKPYNKVWCPKIGRYMKADGFCSEGVMKDA